MFYFTVDRAWLALPAHIPQELFRSSLRGTVLLRLCSFCFYISHHTLGGLCLQFGRQFFYKWTVNWKFLEEVVTAIRLGLVDGCVCLSWTVISDFQEQFLSPQLALSLLGGHLIVLLLFCNFKWCWYIVVPQSH